MHALDLNDTHDPALESWVASANAPDSDFPLQNLPFGRFRPRDGGNASAPRIGVAIGDQVLDLAAAGFVDTEDMSRVMSATAGERQALRAALSKALRRGGADGEGNGEGNGGGQGGGQDSGGNPSGARLRDALRPQAAVEMLLPCRIGDYTDFYASIHHATTVGRQFRPDNPLLPNYRWVPIGYHGRASSIGVSGESFARPLGQTKGPDEASPQLRPSRRLDYELEIGVFIGRPNGRGEPVAIGDAESHVFGLALFNDWSARDVQAWEYQPLGPFLSKSFASTLSPWIVTTEALAPFRRPFVRGAGEPSPLPYLDSPANREAGAFDIELEVWLETAAMRRAGQAPQLLSRSNFADAYWTVAQLVAHHTVNGCNLQSGDLLGSGTLSGPAPEQGGSLLELTTGGKQPLRLANGESRGFLEDGDTVVLRGHCQRAGQRRIGFGECRGTVLPARPAAG